MITETKFNSIIKKVMKHNDYEPTWITVAECDKVDKWTPVDLICREFYNNGCGSAKGFLGITPKQCKDAFEYIKNNNEFFKNVGQLNENGFNNCGFPLWANYTLR